VRYVESLNQALHQLMQDFDNVFVLGEDILDPYGGAFKVTKGLSTIFPDRVIATPISEASMTGFATGLAIRGYRPILEIMFGDFLTLCADQIINGASKFYRMYGKKLKVPLAIRAPMGGRRGYGPTHSQTLETLFLGVPGLDIIAPSHYHDPGELLYRSILCLERPMLFIESKLLYGEQLKRPDEDNKLDGCYWEMINNCDNKYPTILLRIDKDEQPDVTLIAYGGMSQLAFKAAMNSFFSEEICTDLLIPSLIKPLPLEDFLPSIKRTGKVVIVEESVRTSGWGAELACQITEKAFGYLKKPIVRVGAKELPIPSSKLLEDKILPQIIDIEEALLNC
jgi:pyruvate/2-oxoglutarate/acetoin dehydrogenase E1 component